MFTGVHFPINPRLYSFYAGKTKNTIVKTNITHPTSPKNIILHQ